MNLSIFVGDHFTYRPSAQPLRISDGSVLTRLILDDEEAPNYYFAIEGEPGQLRRLAAALDKTADEADAWAAVHPTREEGTR